MLSRLDKIFKTLPRHTEHLETDFGLRHHDDEKNREDANEKDEDDSLFSDDKATVSIPALLTLLESLINNDDKEAEAITDQTDSNEPFVERRKQNLLKESSDTKPQGTPPAPTHAIKAVNAYQKGRSTSPHEPAIKDRRKHSQPHTTLNDVTLSSEEKRHIMNVIDDLTMLSKNGYTDLTIEKNSSFLNGIIAAVEKLKIGYKDK